MKCMMIPITIEEFDKYFIHGINGFAAVDQQRMNDILQADPNGKFFHIRKINENLFYIYRAAEWKQAEERRQEVKTLMAEIRTKHETKKKKFEEQLGRLKKIFPSYSEEKLRAMLDFTIEDEEL